MTCQQLNAEPFELTYNPAIARDAANLALHWTEEDQRLWDQDSEYFGDLEDIGRVPPLRERYYSYYSILRGHRRETFSQPPC